MVYGTYLPSEGESQKMPKFYGTSTFQAKDLTSRDHLRTKFWIPLLKINQSQNS